MFPTAILEELLRPPETTADTFSTRSESWQMGHEIDPTFAPCTLVFAFELLLALPLVSKSFKYESKFCPEVAVEICVVPQ